MEEFVIELKKNTENDEFRQFVFLKKGESKSGVKDIVLERKINHCGAGGIEPKSTLCF